MKNYLFILIISAVFLGLQGSEELDFGKYTKIIENFNLNKKIPRTELLSPSALEKPDPGKVAEALAHIYEYKAGMDKFDLETGALIKTQKHWGMLSQEMRKKFLENIDGYDMSFLSDQFDECPCDILGRQPGFISFRDLVEKKISDMILHELEKSDFVRYVSVGSGGYYFDYRMLQRTCLASKFLKKGKILEVFFIDPDAPLIPDIEKLLQQPQYTCKNLKLKLYSANIELKELSFCPTIIGGMDISLEFVLNDLLILLKKCQGSIRGVLICGGDIVENAPQINFLTLAAKDNKHKISELEKSGYEKGEAYLAKQTESDVGSKKETTYTASPGRFLVYVKKFPFNEAGLKKFKDELVDTDLILFDDISQYIDSLMNKLV